MKNVRRRSATFKAFACLSGLFIASLLSAQTESGPGTNAPVASTNAPAASEPPPAATPKPLASFTVGDKTFENVTLTGFDGASVMFSHAYGSKTMPIAAFTTEQIEMLNKTTDRLFIDAGVLDLAPPSPEAVKEAEALVQSAGEVNGLLANGNTPLTEAISNGRSDIIKVLIARNANVTMSDGSGTTPLKEAEARGNEKIIALLKSAGAKHAPKALQKTDYMLECEKNIQELRAKAKKAADEAKAFKSKADSYRRKAAQSSRALANQTEKQQAQQYVYLAETEDRHARNASENAAYYEKQIKGWESSYADEARRQAAQAERLEKQEAIAREQTHQQEQRSTQAAAQEQASAQGAIPQEPYRDPAMEQMQAQQQQAQAAVKTAQSMMDILESKTAAEKEIARQVAETKEKLSKVPGYVKYVVWCGALFFVGGYLWFISMAFYESMMWGLLCFFLGAPLMLIYFIMHVRETWTSFAFCVFGFLMWWIPVMVYKVGLFDFLF